MSATKQDLADSLKGKSLDNNADRVDVINHVLGTLGDLLISSGRVELRGFGTFSTREKAAGTARNPRTGEQVATQAKTVVHFKPAEALKEKLN